VSESKVENKNWLTIVQCSTTVANTGSGARSLALFLEGSLRASFMTRSFMLAMTASSTGREFHDDDSVTISYVAQIVVVFRSATARQYLATHPKHEGTTVTPDSSFLNGV
jgi:hypothetical protein